MQMQKRAVFQNKGKCNKAKFPAELIVKFSDMVGFYTNKLRNQLEQGVVYSRIIEKNKEQLFSFHSLSLSGKLLWFYLSKKARQRNS